MPAPTTTYPVATAPPAPEAFSDDELLHRAGVLTGLASRLLTFAATDSKVTAELERRVREVLRRYGDLRPETSLRPGTPLERYFQARLQAVRAASVAGIRMRGR